jgi:hypothetical protein
VGGGTSSDDKSITVRGLITTSVGGGIGVSDVTRTSMVLTTAVVVSSSTILIYIQVSQHNGGASFLLYSLGIWMDFKEELQRQFVRSGMFPKDRDIIDDECTCVIVMM